MKKILVIDDIIAIVKGIKDILEKKGFQVITAYNGKNAIEKAKSELPDLILCDIVMPETDGFAVLKAIREFEPIAAIPFIFISAFSDLNNQRIAMDSGADDFLHKSEIKSKLLTAIQIQFDKRNRIQRHFLKRMTDVGKNISYALPHEFRTALNEVSNLANYLNQMAGRIDEHEIKEISNDIIASNKRLMKITENFLVYARIQEFHDNPEQMELLRSFITEEPLSIIRSIGETISEKYDRLNDFYIESGNDHISLEISSENFFKIFSELIDNAFKFSQADSKVNVNHWIDDNYMYFEINDSGRGMNKKQISNIGFLSQFERDIYEQQGAGLGLTISKLLIELHGGTFKLMSKVGVGTDIILKLFIKQYKPL